MVLEALYKFTIPVASGMVGRNLNCAPEPEIPSKVELLQLEVANYC